MATFNSESGKEARAKAGPRGKSERTLAWEALGEFFTDEGAERAKEIMMSADDETFMEHYKSLIELFKPKLARSETKVTSEVTQKQVFKIGDQEISFE